MATAKMTPVVPSETKPTMPFRRILIGSFGGGLVLAIGGLLWSHGDFALGAVVGSILACGGLLHMKYALKKSLTNPENGSPAPFLVASAIRWVAWAVVLFLLLRVSLACMLGAALSYMVYLVVLAFHGVRYAPVVPSKSPTSDASDESA
jgi:hypothetical protein